MYLMDLIFRLLILKVMVVTLYNFMNFKEFVHVLG